MVDNRTYLVDGERQQPELTRRLADGASSPSDDQFCVVQQAEANDPSPGTITCDGLGVIDGGFRLMVPPEAVRGEGALARVMVGDLVRVHGHGVIRKVHEVSGSGWRRRSTSRWQIEEIPADGISITARSTCCAAQPPGEAAE